MVKLTLFRGASMADLGLLPAFFSDTNQSSAKEQINFHYRHGGGWSPFDGFERLDDNSIAYPGDPPLDPIARIEL